MKCLSIRHFNISYSRFRIIILIKNIYLIWIHINSKYFIYNFIHEHRALIQRPRYTFCYIIFFISDELKNTNHRITVCLQCTHKFTTSIHKIRRVTLFADTKFLPTLFRRTTLISTNFCTLYNY